MKKLKEVMTSGVECMSANTSVMEIAAIMKDRDIGSIPICDSDRLVGMVTDRDIVVKMLAGGLDPDETSASEIMTSPITYCYEEQDIGEAARIMESRHVRRLVVLNAEKRLVGIVSLADLMMKGGQEGLVTEILGGVKPHGRVA